MGLGSRTCIFRSHLNKSCNNKQHTAASKNAWQRTKQESDGAFSRKMTPFMSWNHQGKLPKLQNILQQKHLPKATPWGANTVKTPEILEWNGRSNAANPLVAQWTKGRTKYRASVYNGTTICSNAYKAVTQFFVAHEKIKIQKSMTNMALHNARAVHTWVNEIHHLNVLWLCRIMTVL